MKTGCRDYKKKMSPALKEQTRQMFALGGLVMPINTRNNYRKPDAAEAQAEPKDDRMTGVRNYLEPEDIKAMSRGRSLLNPPMYTRKFYG
jgi:hypothetical protein